MNIMKTCTLSMLIMLLGTYTTQAQNDVKIITQTLDTVNIWGKKASTVPGGLLDEQSRAGILGSTNVLNIPYSQMSLTKKTIELFNDPTAPLANLLQINPSIRSSTSSPMYSDFSMRGINMNGNHMMLNGVPSLYYQFNAPPSHIIERIEITSGPNAGVNGVSMSNNGTDSGATPAPGTINIVTKKAESAPTNSYRLSFSGRGNMAVFLDQGKRLGKNEQWGVRVNAQYMDGELALPGAERNEKNVYLNLDYKGKNSVTNLFVGLFDLRVNEGQRWFTFNGTNAKLPDAPDAKMGYDFKETTKEMSGNILTLNHEQYFSKHLTGFFNLGQNHRSGTKYNSQASLLFDDEGNFASSNRANAQNEAGSNFYSQAGVRGNVQTGEFTHTASFSIDYSWATYNSTMNNGATGLIGGNLYDGVEYADDFYPLPEMKSAVPAWKEQNIGLTLVYMGSYKHIIDIMLGASQKNENFKNHSTDKKITNHNILPTYGITIKPIKELAVYFGHTESFSRGATVGSNYVNANETLDPVRSKMNEVGVKWNSNFGLTTLSYFDTKQRNLIDVTVPDGLERHADGLNRHKGVELTSVGQIIDGLIYTGGFLYLDAEREKTKDGASDGKFVNGAAKFSGSLGLEYKTKFNLGFVGRTMLSGKSYIDSSNANGKTEIPSYATFDAGVNYSIATNITNIRLSAMCYNVANKSYWHGRGGSTTFGLSMPRSFTFSVQFDL